MPLDVSLQEHKMIFEINILYIDVEIHKSTFDTISCMKIRLIYKFCFLY